MYVNTHHFQAKRCITSYNEESRQQEPSHWNASSNSKTKKHQRHNFTDAIYTYMCSPFFFHELISSSFLFAPGGAITVFFHPLYSLMPP